MVRQGLGDSLSGSKSLQLAVSLGKILLLFPLPYRSTGMMVLAVPFREKSGMKSLCLERCLHVCVPRMCWLTLLFLPSLLAGVAFVTETGWLCIGWGAQEKVMSGVEVPLGIRHSLGCFKVKKKKKSVDLGGHFSKVVIFEVGKPITQHCHFPL